MRILDANETAQLLEASSELREIEYKSPFNWASDTWLKECVIRAILGMTNTFSGGRIVVGVTENQSTRKFELTGVTAEQLESFDNYDSIKSTVDGFSTIQTNFDIDKCIHEDKTYVVITVREFPDVPTLCRKDGSTDKLKKDDMYVRSKKAQYSTTRVSELELREIVNMAVDKQTKDLQRRGWSRDIPNVRDFYSRETEGIL